MGYNMHYADFDSSTSKKKSIFIRLNKNVFFKRD